MVERKDAGQAGEQAGFASWIAALEARHLSDLRFAEVTRALRALSGDYVQRRDRVRHAALDGRGKRAAFALFYGPLHFLVTDQIGRELGVSRASFEHIIDVGCGTGAAGAALAALAAASAITGVDRHAWAVEEARWTYRHFRLRARAMRADAARALGDWLTAKPPAARRPRTCVVAAYTVNELTDAERGTLLPLLLDGVAVAASILIIEPIARGVAPWWPAWADAFERAGGRSDEWRFAAALPEPVRALDRAAGLDHREQTARTLWLNRRM